MISHTISVELKQYINWFFSSAMWALFNFHFHKSDSIFHFCFKSYFIYHAFDSISSKNCMTQFNGRKMSWGGFIFANEQEEEKNGKKFLKPRDVTVVQRWSQLPKHSAFFFIIIRRNWNQSTFSIVCFSSASCDNKRVRVYYYVLLDGEIKFSVWNQWISNLCR